MSFDKDMLHEIALFGAVFLSIATSAAMFLTNLHGFLALE
jgi:hypothetical protein